jgi:hypothetical protein
MVHTIPSKYLKSLRRHLLTRPVRKDASTNSCKISPFLQQKMASHGASSILEHTWKCSQVGLPPITSKHLLSHDSGGLFAPSIQADGTRVFAMPLGNGHLPLMTLDDLAVFAVLIFKDKVRYSGQTVNLASEFATGKQVAETLSKVSGVIAIYKPISFDQWNATWPLANLPVSTTDPTGPTWGQSFRMWWAAFEDDILLETRDFDAFRAIYPGLTSLEDWTRETGFDGTPKPLLRRFVDAKSGPGFE